MKVAPYPSFPVIIDYIRRGRAEFQNPEHCYRETKQGRTLLSTTVLVLKTQGNNQGWFVQFPIPFTLGANCQNASLLYFLSTHQASDEKEGAPRKVDSPRFLIYALNISKPIATIVEMILGNRIKRKHLVLATQARWKMKEKIVSTCVLCQHEARPPARAGCGCWGYCLPCLLRRVDCPNCALPSEYVSLLMLHSFKPSASVKIAHSKSEAEIIEDRLITEIVEADKPLKLITATK